MRLLKHLALALCLGVSLPAVSTVAAQAQMVDLQAGVAPPPLPVYVQPPIPGPGYIWTPGYWSWNGSDYFWVPGAWVLPPRVGLLWTPGYWGWNNGVYVFRAGYWGPVVGFYGGVNYGFGYPGVGFAGGYWRGGAFFYNRAVTNITVVNITNVYSRPVPSPPGATRASFNGGAGATTVSPPPADIAARQHPQAPPTAAQIERREAASHDHGALASVNHGAPPNAAIAHPGDAPAAVGAHPGAGASAGVHPGAAAAVGAAGAAAAVGAAHAISRGHGPAGQQHNAVAPAGQQPGVGPRPMANRPAFRQAAPRFRPAMTARPRPMMARPAFRPAPGRRGRF